MMDPKKYNVIIVGGGIAGLAAAKTLGQFGVNDVLLLEAKDKLGGRILTTKLDSGLIELGAQWIHGQDSEVYELAQHSSNVHHERSTEGVGEFRTPRGEQIPSETAQQIVNTIQEHLRQIEEDYDIDMLESQNSSKSLKSASIGSYLQDMYEKQTQENTALSEHETAIRAGLWDWKINFELIDNSCNDLSKLSLYRWGEFEDCSGKPYNNFRFGAQAFVDFLAHGPFVTRAEIKVSCPVIQLNWGSKSVITIKYVDKNSGGKIVTVQANALLLTVSIGVLKCWLPGDCASTNTGFFQPPLPKKFVNIIQALGFDSITKIFLEWETPWWKTREFKGIQLVWPSPDDEYSTKLTADAKWLKSLQGFDPVLDNRNVLMSWASGESAVELELLDADEVGARCTAALRQFMKKKKIPLPRRTVVSKWFLDPYTRGAYSYRSTETDKFPGDLTQILNQPIMAEHDHVPNGVCNDAKHAMKPLFLLAGEALHPTQYSTLHGAFDSGKSQAQKIVNYLTE